MFYYWENY